MDLKILSHACMLVKSGAASVIVDPWLLGSCYWRSWWNYPRASFDEAELASADAVIISHVHWDHWHGPTLKRFFRDKLVIVPDEPCLRSRRDLEGSGFKNVCALRHGETVSIGAIRVTLYQFGMFLNDAAVVIEAEGCSILNANDAKIAGSVLRHIVKRHGPFTFALRSHSSANPRVRFRLEGDSSFVADDREHYFRSFKLFMDAVKPTYAIPFASNHCHLHDDVIDLNGYVSNPAELEGYLARQANRGDWTFVRMLPGSTWNSSTGFQLANGEAFDDLDRKLAEYRAAVAPTLDAYRLEEQKVKLTEGVWKRLSKMVTQVPSVLRGSGQVRIAAYWPDGRQEARVLDFATGSVEPSDLAVATSGVPQMRFPAIVLRDAILKNMFHHAGISKRCDFTAVNQEDMRRLTKAFALLEKLELEVFPVRRQYLGRLVRAYVARWRELFVYAQAAWHLKVKRKPIYLVEETILGGVTDR